MDRTRPIVVIGFLGLEKDSKGKTWRRWKQWRPTVSLAMLPDYPVARLELLHDPKKEELAQQVVDDIREKNPNMLVRRHPFPLRNPWDFEEVYDKLYRFADGYDFKPDQERYRLHLTTGSHATQICMFLMNQSGVIPGQLLQTMNPNSGTRTHMELDLNLERYARLARLAEAARVKRTSILKQGIQTKNKCFNTMIDQIELVASKSRESILLLGPTGAGKTLLASQVYALKQARDLISGPFVPVNCATLKGNNAMSTLFGHVRGAFTGANTARAGLLKSANGGLLFFDEIGELGLDEQAMLLRAIETKMFRPMGCDKEERSDFQLIAGTNRDLRRDVAQGLFREDLLARIDLWTFALPGLRERKEDIEPNLEHELRQVSQAMNARYRMTTESRALFLEFATGPEGLWRANFRDLNAAVRRMSTLCTDHIIGVKEVEGEIARLSNAWGTSQHMATSAPATPVDRHVERVLDEQQASALDQFLRVQLENVLGVCLNSSSLSDAGRKLFAQSRLQKKQPNDADRLRKYLLKFDLTWDDVKGR